MASCAAGSILTGCIASQTLASGEPYGPRYDEPARCSAVSGGTPVQVTRRPRRSAPPGPWPLADPRAPRRRTVSPPVSPPRQATARCATMDGSPSTRAAVTLTHWEYASASPPTPLTSP